MAGARKTSAAHMIMGGNAWLQDLTDFVSGFNVNGAVNIQRLTVLESEGVESIALSAQHSINVPTMFYGDATQPLLDHQADEANYIAAFDPDGDVAYFGQCGFSGLPEQAPTDNVISHTLDIIQTERWSYGSDAIAVTPFTFDSTVISVNLGAALTNARRVMLIVTDYDPAAATSIRVGAVAVTQSVEEASIWDIDISGLPASTATPAVSIGAALTGTEEISGFLLVGDFFVVS